MRLAMVVARKANSRLLLIPTPVPQRVSLIIRRDSSKRHGPFGPFLRFRRRRARPRAEPWKEHAMTPPAASSAYGIGPGEGEALWFNGGLGVLKATGDLTDGRFTVLELLAPKGFASPLHIHRREDEMFLVLS